MNRIKWVLFLGVLASGMMQYASAGSTGTIHFYGAIVEGGCNFKTGGSQLVSSCERGAAKVTQARQISATNPLSFSLPLSLGHVTTQQVNNNPHLALMTVSYN
ncbi:MULTISPECIES: hypothetical protein [Rahnella]|uniref:hypothetical protein n=1 Tax=Rahnella TaxID=34037 RepID=UPI0018A3295B|nr:MULTISPECIES: hypothetical protein [Rahnella]MBF7996235.1 hypothetical protein [Rahnella laticis]MBV6816758.1 hypothetical protein [Rahnella sp. PD12R]